MNLGLISYSGATIAYGIFAVLLIFSWKQSFQGKLLFVTVALSTLWAFFASRVALKEEEIFLAYQSMEIFRYSAWFIFLYKLFDIAITSPDTPGRSYQKFIRWAMPMSIGFSLLLLVNDLVLNDLLFSGKFVLGIVGNVFLALIGLSVLEQLYRNTSNRHRWATKYLFLGIGGIFTYDFYLYADALLFRSIDQDLWDARGVVHIVAVPMLAIASARNKNWSLNLFVSREIVLNTTAILGGGIYLLAMAFAGFYLREYGGDWGQVGQVTVVTLAVVLLFVLLASAQFRARARIFISKHFYKNKYDYRIEWVRLTDDLDHDTQTDAGENTHYKTVLNAFGHIVEARAGSLWLTDEAGDFVNVETWQMRLLDDVLPRQSSLTEFFERTFYVINLNELITRADEYNQLDLPTWVDDMDEPWLIVPLYNRKLLIGFVVLAKPLNERSINWEDRDLLKTAAHQIASYLTVIQTTSQLAQAKQFEVFSRLSAYMVHDLKNIAAELELVALNANRHIDNPEFLQDAFETVENAASDIKRLLEQLRNKKAHQEKIVVCNLAELVVEAVHKCEHHKPVPSYRLSDADCEVTLEKGRLSNVLAHLIDNAQQATNDDGDVSVLLEKKGSECHVEITDTGHGMDANFIRERLFKPFDTTKGNAGMGIGMFESREFIRQCGGDIEVKSEVNKGSRITLRIPSSQNVSLLTPETAVTSLEQ